MTATMTQAKIGVYMETMADSAHPIQSEAMKVPGSSDQAHGLVVGANEVRMGLDSVGDRLRQGALQTPKDVKSITYRLARTEQF